MIKYVVNLINKIELIPKFIKVNIVLFSIIFYDIMCFT